MIGETAKATNIEEFQTPQESSYDENDQEEYLKGLETFKNERQYDGEKAPDTEENKKRIADFKKKRVGVSVIKFATSFGKAA